MSYYTSWGLHWAFIALVFGMLACHFEGWFRIAYITTEIALAVNQTIMILFWLLIYPAMWSLGDLDDPDTHFYMIFYHLIPIVSVVLQLAFTDMALEKRHWWIAAFVMFPVYMLCNCYGVFHIPGQLDKFPWGSIYSIEGWVDYPVMTVFIFFVAAMIQGGLFYCSCSIVDRVWPKREEEYYDYN